EGRSFRPHLRKLQSACLAASAVVVEDEDMLVVEFAEVVRLDADVLPGAQPLAPAFREASLPLPATGCRAVGDRILDLGVCPLGRTPVAALPGRVDRAHEVQIFGHGPASIAKRFA